MPTRSVIVPMWDERFRIGDHLPLLLEWCRMRGADLILADDGSQDGGAEYARRLAVEAEVPVHLLTLPRRGKGAAVLAGLQAAKGEVRLFVDADVPVGMEDLDRISKTCEDGADLAVGDRRAPGSSRRGFTPLRSAVSFLASVVSRLLTGLADSQCGCKAWSAKGAEAILPLCRIEGFASDLEQILLARDAGLSIRSVPVHWQHREGSRVSLPVHLPVFAYDVLRILRRRMS